MALLGQRLRGLAADAGVEIVDCVQDLEVQLDPDSGRVRSLTISLEGQPVSRTVSTSLVVDASGRRGVVRRVVPDFDRWCPRLPQDELCSASDVHHEVADRAGAEEFLVRHGAVAGDSVTFVGVSGGFSTCAVTVTPDLTHVGMVTGCLANGRYSTGSKIVADRCAQEPWIGPPVATGTGVIPLRRPYARLTAGGVALVGDAACQVFPAHGSGIGIGLVAGSMLAEGVAAVDDPGDPHELWRRYQAPFQRGVGSDLLAFDVLRRATTRLGSDGVDGLVRSGLMGAHTTQTGLEQRWGVPPIGESLSSVAKFVRHPALAAVMFPSLARAQLLRAHAGHYPDELDVEALAKWEHRTQQLMGPLPS
jgi:flavin-dependent dehydrogenase